MFLGLINSRIKAFSAKCLAPFYCKDDEEMKCTCPDELLFLSGLMMAHKACYGAIIKEYGIPPVSWSEIPFYI